MKRASIVAGILLISVLFTACSGRPTEPTETTVPSASSEATAKTTDPSASSETATPSEEATKPTEVQETKPTDSQPAKPDRGGQSNGHSEQNKPAVPNKPDRPSQPSKPAAPGKTEEPKPTQPPVKPTEPKPTQPPVKPTEPKPTEPPVYYHDWHFVEEQGHDEVVTEAYDETVTETVYESHVICNGCGKDFGYGRDATNAAGNHCAKDFWDDCEGYHTQRVPVEHETTVHHDAVTQWVVDVPAHWECSVCGKSANDATVLPSGEGCIKH